MPTGDEQASHEQLNFCFQCGYLCENDITYCHACYDIRSRSDFKNEQRWKDSESNLTIVEGHLQKERSKVQRLELVLKSFKRMLEEGIHGDVSILTGDDCTIAHRAVLASRSPVFRAMFEHELKEKTSAVIRVDDIPTAAMKSFLLFLYTGEQDAKALSEHGLALIAAAHKYDVPELKYACEVPVAASVQAHNALDVLLQAKMYDAQYVKRACLECIAQNLKELVQGNEFRSLVLSKDEPELVWEILLAVAGTTSSETRLHSL